MSSERLKCVVVGDGAVGKTCLLIRYAKGEFPSGYVPTIFDSYAVSLPVGGETFDLQLYDTTGQEDYEQLRKLAFTDTDILLVCFSVDFRTSYDNVRDTWVPEIKKYCPGVPFILVGTKIDLRESQGKTVVSKEQGERLARELNAVKYLECSALTNTNVQGVFQEAIITALSDNTSAQSTSSVPAASSAAATKTPQLRARPFDTQHNDDNNTRKSRRNNDNDCDCCNLS